MKIVIGIDKITDITPLVNAGANDFFTGLVDKKNKILNHRPNTSRYNLENIEELLEAVKIAHQYKSKLFLVLNDTIYTNKEKTTFSKKVRKLDKINLDGFIVADFSLIQLFKQLGIKTKLHLSSLAVCSNSEAVKFYKEMGMSRIVIPQQISPLEYGDIFKKINKVETEVFFHLYNNCNNIDGICRYHYGHLFNLKNELPFMPCLYKPNIDTFLGFKSKMIKKMETLLRQPPVYDHLSYLYDFYKLGVDNVKIGIRGYPIEEKIKKVRYLRELLNLIESGISKKDFITQTNIISKKYKNINWSEKSSLLEKYKIKQ